MESKKAVAIRYNKNEGDAPKVIASGQGHIAEKIIEVAENAGVFVKEDANLVHLLSQIDIGHEIPTELYQTVSELLAFVYKVDKEYPKGTKG